MGARATYPIREAFHLDDNTKIETTAKDVGLDLGTVKTIRVVVLGSTVVAPTGNGTHARIEIRDADNNVYLTIGGAALGANEDANGVYIEHVRGALWEGLREVKYTIVAGSAGTGTAGTIAIDSLYIDTVEVNY